MAEPQDPNSAPAMTPTSGPTAAPTAHQSSDPKVKLVDNENILAFMATEYENSLVFTLERGDHLEALRRVDSLYRHPRPYLNVPETLSPISSMLLFCHFQMYMTFTNYMRCHLTYALVGVRKAIDAALTAYVLIEHPGRMPDYKAMHNNFRYIKKYVHRLHTADPAVYPIADVLLKTHETCSQYGAHVDVETLSLMTERIKTEQGWVEQFKYFNVLSEVETQVLLVDSMFTFVEILRIFAPFIRQYTRPEVDFDKWTQALDSVRDYVLNALARTHQRYDAANPQAA